MKLQLSTFEARTPQQIFVRLTEMEKIGLRKASPDRLDHLARTTYLRESGESVEVMTEVQRLCNQTITTYDANFKGEFIPSLWKF